MQYAPTPSELQQLQTLSTLARFEYTIPRLIESEEVWSIGGSDGWLIHEEDDKEIITLWPYRQLAADYAQAQQLNSVPQSVSLEKFLYGVLEQCRNHGITLEILPTATQRGQMIAAENLHKLLEGMLDSGSYFVEG